jgi:Ca-activated chloride channel family protein
MLVTDVSGSMLSTDVKPNRLEAVRRAALRFLERVPSRVNVGAIAFNQRARVLQSPTQDRGLVRNALDGLEASGGTATGVAIQAAVGALGHLPSANGQRPPAAIVLISDGSSTRGIDPVRAARAAGKLHIPVDTVALGTATGTITVPRPGKAPGSEVRHVPPDPTALAAIAKASGGRTYTAVDSTRLSQVYDHLGSQLGRRRVHREITSTFAGGALALVLLGVLASLTWFGRPL